MLYEVITEYLERFDSVVWVVNKELMEEYNDTLPIIENSIVLLGSGFNGDENGSHTGSVEVSPRNRITSYNVCYTKLLRIKMQLAICNKTSTYFSSSTIFSKSPSNYPHTSLSLNEFS